MLQLWDMWSLLGWSWWAQEVLSCGMRDWPALWGRLWSWLTLRSSRLERETMWKPWSSSLKGEFTLSWLRAAQDHSDDITNVSQLPTLKSEFFSSSSSFLIYFKQGCLWPTKQLWIGSFKIHLPSNVPLGCKECDCHMTLSFSLIKVLE